MIEFNCPACGKKFAVRDEHAGKPSKCPACHEPLRVPALPTAAAKSAAPAAIKRATPPPLPARAKPVETPSVTEVVRVEQPFHQTIVIQSPKTRSNSLGVASLVLGVLAFLVSIIPCLGLFSLPLAVVGLLLAIAAGLLALSRGGRGIGFPIAGFAANLMALLVVGFWVHLGSSVSEAIAKRETGPATGPPVLNAVAANQPSPKHLPSSSKPQAPAEPEWFDVSRGPTQLGDISLAVREVKVDHVPLTVLDGEERTSKDKLLMVILEVENASQTRKLDFDSWGGDGTSFIDRHIPKLTDNFGNTYKRIDFGFGSRVASKPGRTSIYPGKSVRDVIVFEEPVGKIGFLRLELPASAFGGSGNVRLQIPAQKIQR